MAGTAGTVNLARPARLRRRGAALCRPDCLGCLVCLSCLVACALRTAVKSLPSAEAVPGYAAAFASRRAGHSFTGQHDRTFDAMELNPGK